MEWTIQAIGHGVAKSAIRQLREDICGAFKPLQGHIGYIQKEKHGVLKRLWADLWKSTQVVFVKILDKDHILKRKEGEVYKDCQVWKGTQGVYQPG